MSRSYSILGNWRALTVAVADDERISYKASDAVRVNWMTWSDVE